MTGFAAPGDADAEEGFRALYDGNFTAVLGYALRRVDQPADAADVVSEVFLVAWRRYDEAPPGDGRPWLFGIARNVLSNYHRSARRRQRLGGRLRDTLQREVEPDPAVGVAEWDRVRRVLLRLGPDDRELLMLVGWDGLTPSDAAGVIGIPPSTARMRLSRARARFRTLWGDAQRPAGHVLDVLPPLVTGEPR
ncbi:sigma-70 family RNA polymerase sigma factor [Nocardioides panacisoli]|uniref:Sigma-70 family RNA polymerase sigma factor n=1 Tax=Nocardioides panacisoli TaxID=627624 RepID=A0ABP7IV70_9ACTN